MGSEAVAPLRQHHHAVQFYENDDSLCATVSGFLAEGLVDGQAGIIIAPPERCERIIQDLAARLIDVKEAQRLGDLVVLDAHETLALFMVGDAPVAELFESHLSRIIEQVLGDHPRSMIRAYGEMVDILWKDGRPDAAIRLEMLWNKLAATYRFSLLCGYSMGSFYKQTGSFEEVCRHHTHVYEEPHGRVLPFSARVETTSQA
jgi:hypothetical protein